MTFATSAFMNTLYALRALGGAFASLSAFRFLLRLPDDGRACGVSALGWICTAKTALHSLHCTEVMPSGRRTCRCAEQLGQVTWNHCFRTGEHTGACRACVARLGWFV